MNEALLSVQTAEVGATQPARFDSSESPKARASLTRRQRVLGIALLLVVIVLLGVRIYSLVATNTVVNLKLKSRSNHQLLEDTLIEFSFSSMVSNFWSAQAYIISILIVFGSAVVPITSSIFLVVYLLRKLTAVTSRYEHWIDAMFMLLDSSSKFALVDVFFLSYVVIILGNEIVVFDLVYVHINANPVYALYTGASATLLLMCCFRVISYTFVPTHRMATVMQESHARESLVRRFAPHGRQPLLLAWLAFVVGLAGLGLLFQRALYDALIAFKLKGLAGSALGKEGEKTFEVAKVGVRFVENVDEAALGPVYLSTVYVAVAIVAPGILFILWALYCGAPLRESERQWLGDACLALFQLSGLEVLVIATFAAYLEMYLIADWVFDDQFPTLCADAAKFLNDPCVDLTHRLGPAFWSMLLCVALQVVAVLMYRSYRLSSLE